MVTRPALHVFVEGTPAGVLAPAGGRSRTGPVLTYSGSYRERADATPVSVSLPIQSAPMAAGAWIDGALPDSSRVREAWAVRHGAPSPAPFDLLSTPAGLECAGAVQFCRQDRLPDARGLRSMPEEQLARWVRTARSARIPVIGPAGGRGGFSLPGAQPKHALYWDGSSWHLPYGGHPTNRIIKVGVLGRRYPDADVAEHITMQAASLLGLRVAATELLEANGERFLSVHRFDRRRRDARPVRIHSEDLCQATGRSPVLKYERFRGGLGASEAARLLRSSSGVPHDDVRLFLDLLAFSWMTAGTDAHGKNYSLLLRGGSVRLAPAYDLISAYGWQHSLDPACDRTLELTMRVGSGGYHLCDGDSTEAWGHVAVSCGVEPGALLRRVRWAGCCAVARTPSAPR